jgi:hypothetical protein
MNRYCVNSEYIVPLRAWAFPKNQESHREIDRDFEKKHWWCSRIPNQSELSRNLSTSSAQGTDYSKTSKENGEQDTAKRHH